MVEVEDKRLGRKVSGRLEYPETTLGGRDFDHVHNPPAITGLPHDYFVVLDPFPVDGIDVGKELDALEVKIKEAHARPSAAPTAKKTEDKE